MGDEDLKTREDIANERKHNDWKNELIRIGLPGDPSSIRRIPRHRISAQNVNKTFQLERGVYFLRDETDEVVWPDDWMINCQPAPVLYIVNEKPLPPRIKDAQDHLLYEGGFALIAKHVPRIVDEKALDEWLRVGLKSEDPEYVNVRDAVKVAEKQLFDMDDKIKRMPYVEIKMSGTGGAAVKLSAKERQHERKAQSDFLHSEMERVGTEVAILTKKLQHEERRNLRERMRLEVVGEDAEAKTREWLITFSKWNYNPLVWGRQAVHKKDWGEFKIAHLPHLQGTPDYECRVFEGKIPEEIMDEGIFEMINMRGVRVTRVEVTFSCYFYLIL